MAIPDLDGEPGGAISQTPLGLFAFRLRQYMCAGSDAVLLREDMRDKIFLAYAGVEANSGVRTLAAYTAWVARLATKEYADELVVMACALELQIKIDSAEVRSNCSMMSTDSQMFCIDSH